MDKQTILTGITTTGTPHLGNYAGAIKQAIRSSKKDDHDSFLFLADYHSLIKNKNPEEILKNIKIRQKNSLDIEFETACREVEKIALLRLKDIFDKL